MSPARAALLAALAAHPPADDAEAADLAQIVAFVSGSDRCFDRAHYDPGHVTGSAFVLDAVGGRVLLHHHRRLDRWLQLGGHDDGEHDPALTATREAREESGLGDLTLAVDVILDVDVHVIPAGRGEPAHEHHDVRFALLTGTPRAIAHDAEESHGLAWLSVDEAATRMNEPGATRALEKLAALIR